MGKPLKDENKNFEKIHEKLSEEYYKPEHLWVGRKAIKKLFQNTGISKKKIKSWLAKQTLWQVHIPPPKDIQHPHFQVTTPINSINLISSICRMTLFIAVRISIYLQVLM